MLLEDGLGALNGGLSCLHCGGPRHELGRAMTRGLDSYLSGGNQLQPIPS